MRSRKAFTILEVVSVMGLLVAASFFAIPFLISQIQETNAQFFASQMTSSIFLLQQNAYSQKAGDANGIRITQDSYILFDGTNFASGNVIGEVDIPSNLKINNINLTGGANDIIFPDGSVVPSASGSFQVSDGSAVYIITINSEGLVNYTSE